MRRDQGRTPGNMIQCTTPETTSLVPQWMFHNVPPFQLATLYICSFNYWLQGWAQSTSVPNHHLVRAGTFQLCRWLLFCTSIDCYLDRHLQKASCDPCGPSQSNMPNCTSLTLYLPEASQCLQVMCVGSVTTYLYVLSP